MASLGEKELKEEDKVQGCYRSLKELLLKLPELYLCQQNGHNFVWFDEPNTFHVSLGADGAPFGKYDSASAWLVGFLNLGKGILSSNETIIYCLVQTVAKIVCQCKDSLSS